MCPSPSAKVQGSRWANRVLSWYLMSQNINIYLILEQTKKIYFFNFKTGEYNVIIVHPLISNILMCFNFLWLINFSRKKNSFPALYLLNFNIL